MQLVELTPYYRGDETVGVTVYINPAAITSVRHVSSSSIEEKHPAGFNTFVEQSGGSILVQGEPAEIAQRVNAALNA